MINACNECGNAIEECECNAGEDIPFVFRSFPGFTLLAKDKEALDTFETEYRALLAKHGFNARLR